MANHIRTVLHAVHEGEPPTTRRFIRMAEGSKITPRLRRVFKATYWTLRILIYGSITLFLAWLMA